MLNFYGSSMTINTTWRPFAMVSLTLVMGTIGTALASPLYPIYQQVWHLSPSQITYIFVAYMFGCLGSLLFLGRTSNSIGFLRTLQIGLVFISLGLIISVFADNALILSVGRFIIGIASGLMTTSAMIGMMQTIPESHKQFAPQLVLYFAAGQLHHAAEIMHGGCIRRLVDLLQGDQIRLFPKDELQEKAQLFFVVFFLQTVGIQCKNLHIFTFPSP